MKFIDNLEGIVSSKIAVAKGIWSLIKLEAKLAQLTIYPLLVNICSLAVLLLTVWLSAMVLLAYFITIIAGYFLAGIVAILLLNCCFLFLALKYLSRNLRQLSFEKTRACLASNKLRDADERQSSTTGLNSQNGNERIQRKSEASSA